VKVGILVGTRPEIIKMAPVVRACQRRGTPFTLLHTGQHYSFEMDGVFFRELGLPAPDANLEVGSGAAPAQLGAMLRGLEPLLARQRPDVLLVEGDTNSVLAGALAARKLGIAVGHVEAGLRSYDRRMPEELNRILTDHVADMLFAPTARSRDILLGEGIDAARIHVTGNTVVDELLLQRDRALRPGLAASFGVESGRYALATVHRAENTDDGARLRGIVEGLAGAARALGLPVLVALHPRTTERLAALGIALAAPLRALPPLPYLDFLGLHAEAALMLTDSGGLQEEACTLGVPCVTLRDNTERPESVDAGANVLAGADPARIAECATVMRSRARGWPNPFGDGHSGERIVELVIGA
jgi:UDP-N-acetylglucosamine 2-epimerase (non-hydrolysing)